MPKCLLDSNHSSAEFAVRHMMVTWVVGLFTKIAGTLTCAPVNVAAAAVAVEVDAGARCMGVGKRDNHLKSEDFLDVARYPTITMPRWI